ncbi:MAG: FxDxF family PEP-CTERM protein [Pseudomonadota bacterium]
MKKLFTASVVALAALASVNASAQVYNAGFIAPNNTPQLLHNGFVGIGALSDTINFTLLSNVSNANVAAASFEFGSFLHIDNFKASLYDSANNLIGSGASYVPFATGSLVAGNYHLDVTGNVTGQFGGAYSANITPAPEPETWAMMLAGLGLVASATRRKKSA